MSPWACTLKQEQTVCGGTGLAPETGCTVVSRPNSANQTNTTTVVEDNIKSTIGAADITDQADAQVSEGPTLWDEGAQGFGLAGKEEEVASHVGQQSPPPRILYCS